MKNNIALILLLMVPCVLVTSRSVPQPEIEGGAGAAQSLSENTSESDPSQTGPEQVISVRITSSVAVGRGRGKLNKILEKNQRSAVNSTKTTVTQKTTSSIATTQMITETETAATDPPILAGANLEFIKQLNSKKEARGLSNFERVHSFPSYFDSDNTNEANDSIAEASIKSVYEIDEKDDEDIETVPLARSVAAQSPINFIQGLMRQKVGERNNPKLTTVSFNIVHDSPKVTSSYNEPSEDFLTTLAQTETPKPKDQSSNYHKPAAVYSEPAKIYSEPAKFYSEPAKIYSEPAKVYGEPAKVYSEPSKVYGEPSKFYSQPASLHLPPELPKYTPWQHYSQSPGVRSSTITTTPVTTAPNPMTRAHDKDHQPEKNYEVDEKISVLTDGRSHGVQESSTERCKQENCKVGYVVEGRQYRKYRVEEKTSEGFIVGEYGVVRNEDGALRGVRYTADGDASPRLIYDALMKFLQLK